MLENDRPLTAIDGMDWPPKPFEDRVPVDEIYPYHYSDVIMSVMAFSNHQPHDCSLNHLFRSKKISKPRVTGLCEGNSPVTGEFPAQRASNVETISIWWHHQPFLKWGAETRISIMIGFTYTLKWESCHFHKNAIILTSYSGASGESFAKNDISVSAQWSK